MLGQCVNKGYPQHSQPLNQHTCLSRKLEVQSVSGTWVWRLDGAHPTRRGFDAIVHVRNTSGTQGVKPLHSTVVRRSPCPHRGTSCIGLQGRSCLSLRLEQFSVRVADHNHVSCSRATHRTGIRGHFVHQGTTVFQPRTLSQRSLSVQG